MSDHKIGLTIFLLREDRISSFREELLDPHAASSIPLSQPLEGTFIPFPSQANASQSGLRPWGRC